MERIMHGTLYTGSSCSGFLLACQEPLSFWGGYNQETGEIIDRRHSLSGKNAGERILAIPFSRGSSTTTAVLLEAIRNHKAPLAILTQGIDRFFVLASVVADEMYGTPIVVVALSENDFKSLQTGQWVEIMPDGRVVLRDP